MPDSCIRVRVDGAGYRDNQLRRLKNDTLELRILTIGPAPDAVGPVFTELSICAPDQATLDRLREKLGTRLADGRMLTEIVASPPAQQPAPIAPGGGGPARQASPAQRPAPIAPGGGGPARQAPPAQQPAQTKPYGFVPLPEQFTADAPVWHDGTSSAGRLSGEIRCELATLTPLLVGWERALHGDPDADWPVPAGFNEIQPAVKKWVLSPLRAPWGRRPVIIPGDTLKGLLRHELGALLGAPMERVDERSYSYRPNAMFPNNGSRLRPRLARVPAAPGGVSVGALDGIMARVPARLELLPINLNYQNGPRRYRFAAGGAGGTNYRGGQGAGNTLNSRHGLHYHVAIDGVGAGDYTPVDVPPDVQRGYLATVRHLADTTHGHFASRHPDIPRTVGNRHSLDGEAARQAILSAAQSVFQPGDIIWVEWDTQANRIVSLGWHYYYRWAYTDTVRTHGDPTGTRSRLERRGLFPTAEELERDPDVRDAPRKLTAVRRIFGYTGDNEGSKGIGENTYTQLMGRVSINAGLEVVTPQDTDATRFVGPTFLKELGMPRPSAVEHYLKQPYHPNATRPGDAASLVTYGDAAGRDAPGTLAGRKFYLDRNDAYTRDGRGAVPGPAADAGDNNRQNSRSTLALEASRPGRTFRFTLRFRDLDGAELSAILAALCPHQFRQALGGTHQDGYCSKLGYARPLGWGSVRITAQHLLFLDETDGTPTLRPEPDIPGWFSRHLVARPLQSEWLAIHRHRHPAAGDYPRANGQIYTYHTNLRANHSRLRRNR